MAKNLQDRLAGMVWGSLVGDALALGAHWIYDQEELEKTFGRVADFRAPLTDSYHPKKHAGEQTHYGDQELTLLDSLAAKGRYDERDFAARWRTMWDGYEDYFDHATKDTLANLERGVPAAEAGSASEELGGASRVAPLLAMLHGEPLKERVLAARAQTALTHASPLTLDSAEFLTRIVDAVLSGEEIAAAIESTTVAEYRVLRPREILKKVAATQALDARAAAVELGLSCPAAKAVPTTLAILARHGDDLETALIENVMAGGDSAARALALGMILGARHGASAIPPRWINGLKAKSRVEAFLA